MAELTLKSLPSDSHDSDWKSVLSNLLSDPQELCEQLALQPRDAAQLIAACADFPLRVPRPYLQRMQRGRLDDPLLLQVLPQAQELQAAPGYSADPLQERHCSPVDGLLHKYAGRVLLVMNSVCAIHCRYCFRRHFPYAEHRIDAAQWQQILDYIRSDDSIEEVILSGGDPLSATDSSLQKRIRDLENIAHLQRLRLHTRLPVVIPQRVTEALCTMLRDTRLHAIIVIHANHAQEIDHAVATALLQLNAAGITLLNQSVLLKGINDDVTTLKALSQRLLACNTLPYYLHLLDKVQGAHHFYVDPDSARQLHAQLQASTSGYLVPKLVTESYGEKNKVHLR